MSQVMCILLFLLIVLTYTPRSSTLYFSLLFILDNIGIVRFLNFNQSSGCDLFFKNDHSGFAA